MVSFLYAMFTLINASLFCLFHKSFAFPYALCSFCVFTTVDMSFNKNTSLQLSLSVLINGGVRTSLDTPLLFHHTCYLSVLLPAQCRAGHRYMVTLFCSWMYLSFKFSILEVKFMEETSQKNFLFDRCCLVARKGKLSKEPFLFSL